MLAGVLRTGKTSTKRNSWVLRASLSRAQAMSFSDQRDDAGTARVAARRSRPMCWVDCSSGDAFGARLDWRQCMCGSAFEAFGTPRHGVQALAWAIESRHVRTG